MKKNKNKKKKSKQAVRPEAEKQIETLPEAASGLKAVLLPQSGSDDTGKYRLDLDAVMHRSEDTGTLPEKPVQPVERKPEKPALPPKMEIRLPETPVRERLEPDVPLQFPDLIEKATQAAFPSEDRFATSRFLTMPKFDTPELKVTLPDTLTIPQPAEKKPEQKPAFRLEMEEKRDRPEPASLRHSGFEADMEQSPAPQLPDQLELVLPEMPAEPAPAKPVEPEPVKVVKIPEIPAKMPEIVIEPAAVRQPEPVKPVEAKPAEPVEKPAPKPVDAPKPVEKKEPEQAEAPKPVEKNKPEQVEAPKPVEKKEPELAEAPKPVEKKEPEPEKAVRDDAALFAAADAIIGHVPFADVESLLPKRSKAPETPAQKQDEKPPVEKKRENPASLQPPSAPRRRGEHPIPGRSAPQRRDPPKRPPMPLPKQPEPVKQEQERVMPKPEAAQELPKPTEKQPPKETARPIQPEAPKQEGTKPVSQRSDEELFAAADAIIGHLPFGEEKPVEKRQPKPVSKPVEQPKPVSKPVDVPKPASRPIEQPKPAAKPVEPSKPATKPIEQPKPAEQPAPKAKPAAPAKAEPEADAPFDLDAAIARILSQNLYDEPMPSVKVPTPKFKPAAVMPKPTAAARPVEPAKPAETAKPIEKVKPVEAAKPVETAKPVEAFKPIEKAKPVEPAKPVEAAKPVETAKPIEPAKPAAAPLRRETRPAQTVRPAQTAQAQPAPVPEKPQSPKLEDTLDRSIAEILKSIPASRWDSPFPTARPHSADKAEAAPAEEQIPPAPVSEPPAPEQPIEAPKVGKAPASEPVFAPIPEMLPEEPVFEAPVFEPVPEEPVAETPAFEPEEQQIMLPQFAPEGFSEADAFFASDIFTPTGEVIPVEPKEPIPAPQPIIEPQPIPAPEPVVEPQSVIEPEPVPTPVPAAARAGRSEADSFFAPVSQPYTLPFEPEPAPVQPPAAAEAPAEPEAPVEPEIPEAPAQEPEKPMSALEWLLSVATPIELDENRKTPVPDLDEMPDFAPLQKKSDDDRPEPDLLAEVQPKPTARRPVSAPAPLYVEPEEPEQAPRAELRTKKKPARTQKEPRAPQRKKRAPESFDEAPAQAPEETPLDPALLAAAAEEAALNAAPVQEKREPRRRPAKQPVSIPISDEPTPEPAQPAPEPKRPRPAKPAPVKKPQIRKPKPKEQPALDPEEAFRRYTRDYAPLGSRFVAVIILTVLGLFFTLYAGLGWDFLPELFNGGLCAYLLLVLMLITVGLSTNVWKNAVDSFFERSFPLDSLLLVGALFAAVDTFFAAHTGRVPLCAVVQLLLCFSLWGKYCGLLAKLTSMRVLRQVEQPIGIVEVQDLMKGHRGILRSQGNVEEFMKHFERTPQLEQIMRIYAPAAAVLSLVLGAVLSILAKVEFFWTVSLLLLASVPLAGFIGYSRAFYRLSRRLDESDAALCGWHGATVFGGNHTILVSDADIFPRGSLALNGYKIFKGSPDRVIGYAAAAVRASKSALHPLFEELLEQHNGRHYSVDNFRFYDTGGIGAEIGGTIVLVGSGAFMRRMGVHMEPGMKVQQAAYVSVDGELAGVFAIRYAAPDAVQRGLTAVGRNRHFKTTLITRCFLGTPGFLKSKFDIPTSNIAYPSTKERLRLSETELRGDEQGAILAEDSFGAFAEAAAGGRQLDSCGKGALALALGSGAVSFLLMAILAALGAVGTASTLNVLLFFGIWAIPTILLTAWAERY